MSNIAVVQQSSTRRRRYSNDFKVISISVSLAEYALIKKQAAIEDSNPCALGRKLFKAHCRKRRTTISA